MSLISSLFGGFGGGKRRSIGDVEAALSRVAAERDAARIAVADTLKKRDDLLLIGSDAEIKALDAELDRRRLVQERLDKAEPALLQELALLRTASKAALWAELSSKYHAASLVYRDRLRAAVEAQADVLNQHDAIRAAGFEHESRALVPVTRWVTKEALFEYDALIEGSREAARPRPAPKPAAPVQAKPAPKAIAPKQPKAPPKQATKPRFEPKPDEAGNINITVIRGGLEVAGQQRRAAEIVNLPFDQGLLAVQSGGAEFEGALQ